MTRKQRASGRMPAEDEMALEHHALDALRKLSAAKWCKHLIFLWNRFELLSSVTQRRLLFEALAITARRGEPVPESLLPYFKQALDIKAPKSSYALSTEQVIAAKALAAGKSDRAAAKAAHVSHTAIAEWKHERHFLSQMEDEWVNLLLSFRQNEIAAGREIEGDVRPDGTIDLERIATRYSGR